MREILFRGKCKKGDRWIEGFLFQTYYESFEWCISTEPLSANDYSEIIGDWAEVDPETVGQYTGLTDKNGKKIFEGDIVKYDGDGNYSIGYANGVYRLFDESGYYFVSVHNYYSYLEVIGNIHDNPELLKGGGNNV